MSWKDLTGSTKAAIIFAILGFVISLNSTQTSNIGGQASCSYMDFGALILGGIAILAALSGLLNARDLPAARHLNMGLCALALLVGLVHIGRGLGMIGGPC